MRRTHRLTVRSAWVVVCWCACISPVLAQSVIFVGQDPLLQDPGVPWGLPAELLDRLALQAADFRTATSGLECSETTQRVRYPRGRAAEGAMREATYIFRFADGLITPVRVQGSGTSVRRYGKSKAPPAHAWMQLFASRNQPYFAYRDLGEVPHDFGSARRIQFRGSLPYSDGADIRQWEGTVLIDPYSLRPLELDARPLHLWPRLERKRRDYVRSFKLNFFGLLIRFKKRPIAERVHVRFDVQSNGLTLPADAHVERFEMTSPDQAVVRSRVVMLYEHDFKSNEPDAAR